MSYLLALGSSVLGASLSVLTCYEVFQIAETPENKTNLKIAKVAGVATSSCNIISGGLNAYNMIQSSDSGLNYLDVNSN